jgi:hypothetical protein
MNFNIFRIKSLIDFQIGQAVIREMEEGISKHLKQEPGKSLVIRMYLQIF